LGLGGEPRLLGRASDIETFVMNGEDEGEIEIEVVNTEGGENPIIRRVIRRDASPKSSFFWNDKGTTGKHVRETCLQKYQISVDNLCTFLPQDRVGSFSGFDAKQLLIETEKSLSSSQHLYHTHQQLIQDQIDLQGGTNQVETLEEKLQQLQVENQRLEREKQRMEERQVALEQAELLRKKLIWLKFDEARCEANAKKEAKQNLKLQVREAAALATPLEEKATDLAEQLTRCTKDFATLDKHIKSHQTEMQKQTRKYEMHDDAIETTLQELNAMDSHRAQLESKVQQHKEKVENYNQILEQSPSMDALQEEELQARNDHKAAHPEYEAAKRDLRQLEEELRDVDEEHREKKKKWTKLQDEKARRRERVFRQQNNLRQSYEWLQNNRNQFRKEVIGPIVCEITPKSRNTAAYLEQHVPNSTLKSFVVQCKEDYDLLYQSVRQGLKVPINIIVVKDIPPPKPRQYSEQKMQVLKRDHGVIGYCDESFTAPDIVVQALKATSAIDKVLVGTEKTQQSLDNNNLLDYLAEPENGGGLQSCCIFASEGDRSFKYTSTISKYSGKPSLRVDEVRPAKWLAPGVSDEEKGKVEQELNELDQRKEKAQTAVQDANNKVAEIQQQAQSIMTKLKTAKANVGDLQKLINKLRNAEHKLKEAEKEVATDDEDEKKQKIGQLNKRIRHSLLALDAQAESYKKMMIATVKISGARLNREVVVVEERKAR
jgi:chromosome segregation ATPase